MHVDPELLILDLAAILLFGGAALYLPKGIAVLQHRRNLKAPHSALLLVVRLWFAALALASLALMVFSRHALPTGR